MAERIRLRCAALDVTLRLPWWPEEVTRTPSGWNVNTLDRPGRAPLDVPSSRTTEELSFAFVLREQDYRASVQTEVRALERLAAASVPVQVLMGERNLGLWRLEPPQVTETAWAPNDEPSVVDVSLVLKRASDAIVNVGPVKRARKVFRVSGVSRQV